MSSRGKGKKSKQDHNYRNRNKTTTYLATLPDQKGECLIL